MKIASDKKSPGQSGFTMVELMVVIAIVGILAAMAFPSFNRAMDRQRVKNASTDIYIALTRARSEALKQNRSVSILPKSGTTDWAWGWSIDNPAYPGKLLEDHYATKNLVVSGPTSVVYKSSGRATSPGVTTFIQFTVSGQYPGATQYVCVDLSGRPAINATGSC